SLPPGLSFARGTHCPNRASAPRRQCDFARSKLRHRESAAEEPAPRPGRGEGAIGSCGLRTWREGVSSEAGLLADAFAARGGFVLAGFTLVMPLADLLFDFFGYQIYGGVKIGFRVLGEQIRPAHRQAHRARELSLRRLGAVVVQCHPNVNSMAVQVVQ